MRHRTLRCCLNLFLLITLVAFGLHSATPQGFMPDSGTHGIRMCDGLHHDRMLSGDSGSPGQKDHSRPCPFATGALGMHSGVLSAPEPASVPFADSPSERIAVIALPQASFGNASPRSPPFFSA